MVSAAAQLVQRYVVPTRGGDTKETRSGNRRNRRRREQLKIREMGEGGRSEDRRKNNYIKEGKEVLQRKWGLKVLITHL
jgi:hypothetical protein